MGMRRDLPEREQQYKWASYEISKNFLMTSNRGKSGPISSSYLESDRVNSSFTKEKTPGLVDGDPYNWLTRPGAEIGAKDMTEAKKSQRDPLLTV